MSEPTFWHQNWVNLSDVDDAQQIGFDFVAADGRYVSGHSLEAQRRATADGADLDALAAEGIIDGLTVYSYETAQNAVLDVSVLDVAEVMARMARRP